MHNPKRHNEPTVLLSVEMCLLLHYSKEIGSLLAEMVVGSAGAVLVNVGYDLCPHGGCWLTIIVFLEFL